MQEIFFIFNFFLLTQTILFCKRGVMFLTRNKFRYFGFGLNLILSRLETAPTSRGFEGGYRKRKLCDEPARRFAMAGGPHRHSYKYWLNWFFWRETSRATQLFLMN